MENQGPFPEGFHNSFPLCGRLRPRPLETCFLQWKTHMEFWRGFLFLRHPLSWLQRLPVALQLGMGHSSGALGRDRPVSGWYPRPSEAPSPRTMIRAIADSSWTPASSGALGRSGPVAGWCHRPTKAPSDRTTISSHCGLQLELLIWGPGPVWACFWLVFPA